jgi:hypothetical protein
MIDTAAMNRSAAECMRMAGNAESARQRTVLFGLAQAWLALSVQAREIEERGAHLPSHDRPERGH